MKTTKLFLISFILLLFTFSFASAALIDDITSYYTFDIDASDSLGVNDGTVSGATLTTGSGGKIGEGYDFDGSTNYIDTNDGGAFVFNNDFTVSAWINRDVYASNNDFIVDKRDANNDGWLFGVIADKLALNIDNSDTLSSDTVLLANTWYYVVAVVDRSGTGKVRLYVNGVEESSYSSQPDVSSDTVSVTADARIGMGSYSLDTNGMDGLIDEVGLWNRALTSTEITSLYNSGSGLQYPFGAATPPSGNTVAKIMGVSVDSIIYIA